MNKKTIFTEDHRYLIEKLKQARIEKNIDQIQAAELLGKTQSYVSKVESGQRRIDVVQLKAFAKIYEKPIDYFLKEK